MSIKIMSRIWEESPADGKELLVELALGDFADDDGKCFPAVATVARKARASDATVHRVIRRLVTERRMRIETQASEYGTNVYTWLHFGGFDKADAQGGVTMTPPPADREPPRRNDTRGGVKTSVEGGVNIVNEDDTRSVIPEDPSSGDPSRESSKIHARDPELSAGEEPDPTGAALNVFAQAMQTQLPAVPIDLRRELLQTGITIDTEQHAVVVKASTAEAAEYLRGNIVKLHAAARAAGCTRAIVMLDGEASLHSA